jgi:chromosome segregation protein
VHDHGGGILSEAVRRDDSGAVNRLLERTAWLPDLASCLELQAAMPAGWLLVSRDGGASVGQLAVAIGLEDGLIDRRAEAQRLTSESTRLTAELETARRSAEASEARRDAATIELGRARDIEATAIAALRLAEDRERTLARAADAAIREAAWLEAQALRLAAEAERARAALPPGPVPESAQSTEPAERPGPDAAVVAIWEARVHEVRQRRDRIAALVAAADAGRQEADRRRAGAEASLAIAQSRVAGLDTTSATVAEREAGLRHERDELSRLLAGAVAREQGAQASLDVLLAVDAGDRDRLAAAEVSAGRAREQVRVGQIRAQGAERDEFEARLGLENLREQLLVELAGLGRLAIRHLRAAQGETEPSGNLTVEPEPAEDADADADSDAVEGELESALEAASRTWAQVAPPADPPSPARLANLRRRFHELGAGNPFAVDEYATLKARLDGLEAQRLDLQAAIDRTRGLILELDALITSQFRATFQALELAFDARFQQLFGGGFARLSLTDPSDLSATGVEIVARPPGKKPQALAMLSGGERALTAVALLFAMLEVRPVPFCVLDEVDAALDEANIGRFTDALRELSQNTQCIVITHNRGTIEIADALYGVTVGEDSVSRVISLRLEDATSIAGRSRSTSPLTSTVEPLPA